MKIEAALTAQKQHESKATAAKKKKTTVKKKKKKSKTSSKALRDPKTPLLNNSDLSPLVGGEDGSEGSEECAETDDEAAAAGLDQGKDIVVDVI